MAPRPGESCAVTGVSDVVIALLVSTATLYGALGRVDAAVVLEIRQRVGGVHLPVLAHALGERVLPA